MIITYFILFIHFLISRMWRLFAVCNEEQQQLQEIEKNLFKYDLLENLEQRPWFLQQCKEMQNSLELAKEYESELLLQEKMQ